METKREERWQMRMAMVLVAGLTALGVSSELMAKHKGNGMACSKTTQAAYLAGKNEIRDDFWIAVGNCRNLSDSAEQAECLAEAAAELAEGKDLLKEQREARQYICGVLGEAPYDPDMDPANFVDFEAVLEDDAAFEPNPYFPLIAGTSWEYHALEDDEIVERIFVEVLDETKEILGINCIVVHDQVWEINDGEEMLIEDTFDWYTQHVVTGDVWYMGEISLNFEEGELVDIEGSWKAGRDSAKAGISIYADPQVDALMRQEFALGNAEDIAEVVSVGEESVEVPFGDYDTDVLKTKEWTPIEPDAIEFKFYAPGVGMVLEAKPGTTERVELVDMIAP